MPAPATLLVGASGTGLSNAAKRLEERGAHVVDLEAIVCQDSNVRALLGLGPDESTRMDVVTRQLTRPQLYAAWSRAANVARESLRTRDLTQPSVVATHLYWYDSNLNEHFTPATLQELRALELSQIVVLLDDVFDMYARLDGKTDIFGTQARANASNQLAKLAFRTTSDSTPDEIKQVTTQVKLEAVEHSVERLITWRRTEMIHAEHLARELGIALTPLGVKHSLGALHRLVAGELESRVYLSHRITEVRGMNRKTSALPGDIGTWAAPAHEVGSLHTALSERGVLLINPTAIDELRFGPPSSPPRLSHTWVHAGRS